MCQPALQCKAREREAAAEKCVAVRAPQELYRENFVPKKAR